MYRTFQNLALFPSSDKSNNMKLILLGEPDRDTSKYHYFMKVTKIASNTWCSSRESLTVGSAIRNIVIKI